MRGRSIFWEIFSFRRLNGVSTDIEEAEMEAAAAGLGSESEDPSSM
jgi:hypothetical protein